MRTALRLCLVAALVSFGVLCDADEAALRIDVGMGPNPTLPPPRKSLLPATNAAKAQGWRDGKSLVGGECLAVENRLKSH
jgi:hypothetical protein